MDPEQRVLDVVVPSAAEGDVARRTLEALQVALSRCPGVTARIVIADDRPVASPRRIPLPAGPWSIVRTSGGLGPGPARNAGAAAGTAAWLVFVDDDVTVDPLAITSLLDALREGGISSTVGQLRAPESAPRWLLATYRAGTLETNVGEGGHLPGYRLTSALCSVSRRAFDEVGGFPQLRGWGLEDPLFGHRLDEAGHALRGVPGFSGTHWYVPTWEQWLTRRERAGQRFAELERELGQELRPLTDAVHLTGGLRSVPKRLAGRLPPSVLSRARGDLPRRLAAAGAEARGFRLERAARRNGT